MKLCIDSKNIETHSETDLITNSSTTIYTFSDGSERVCKEMIDEIFTTFGIDKKCDDVFCCVVLFDESCHYRYYIERHGGSSGDLDKLIKQIKSGELPKPQWMLDAENSRNKATTLFVTPKEPKYHKLAQLITGFLYSTRTEEVCD